MGGQRLHLSHCIVIYKTIGFQQFLNLLFRKTKIFSILSILNGTYKRIIQIRKDVFFCNPLNTYEHGILQIIACFQ